MLIQIHLFFAQNKDYWASCLASFLQLPDRSREAQGKYLFSSRAASRFLLQGGPAVKETTDETFLGLEKLQHLLTTHCNLYCTFTDRLKFLFLIDQPTTITRDRLDCICCSAHLRKKKKIKTCARDNVSPI